MIVIQMIIYMQKVVEADWLNAVTLVIALESEQSDWLLQREPPSDWLIKKPVQILSVIFCVTDISMFLEF